MSIKSQTGGGSDKSGVLIENQRGPNYGSKGKQRVPKEHIDNISGYVSQNLKNTVKPRHGEHR